MNLSIIIPTLNEEDRLGDLLEDLRRQHGVDLQIIIADGGSQDRTIEIARAHHGSVVISGAGRARQMNAGAAVARSDWLFFVHADTRIHPPDLLSRALDQLAAHHTESAPVAGHFALRFPSADCEGCFRYRYLERKTLLNRTYTIHGDQGLLIHRDFFDEIGGYDASLSCLEDQLMARAIEESGSWLQLPGELHTSTRRFETRGFGRSYLKMAVFMSAFVSESYEFFDIYDEIYEADVDRVFQAIWIANQRLSPEERIETWRRVLKFIVENAWQLFFGVDVLLEPYIGVQTPLLDLYERLIEISGFTRRHS